MKALAISFLLMIALGCQNIDIEHEKQLIQAQMDLIAGAHEQQDAYQFYQPNADRWVDVRNGTIIEVNKEEVQASTQAYLSSMDFHELVSRDVPRIEISDDGTLASYIGSVTVKGMLGENPVYWPVSWQSVLRKIEGEWKIISTANTEADETTTALLLLNRIREQMGISGPTEVSSIYAHALCQGPLRSFETLVFSSQNAGKLEQLYGEQHILLKHGEKTSWTYNLNKGIVNEQISDEMKSSIVGHELHWLSLWPEHRYSNITFKGIYEFNDNQAFLIEMKNGLSRVVNFYYSFDNYIPLGFRYQASDDTDDIVSVIFENWEIMQGISIFKRAVLEHEKELFEYEFTDIRINQLEDKDFDSREAIIG